VSAVTEGPPEYRECRCGPDGQPHWHSLAGRHARPVTPTTDLRTTIEDGSYAGKHEARCTACGSTTCPGITGGIDACPRWQEAEARNQRGEYLTTYPVTWEAEQERADCGEGPEGDWGPGADDPPPGPVQIADSNERSIEDTDGD